MRYSLKDYLYLSIIGTLVIFALSTIWFVAAYSRAVEPTSFRSFLVSGEGSSTAIPDIVQFSFGILTQGGTDLTATQEENTTNANNTIAFVKEQGIEDKDITTKAYRVDPRYEHHICNEFTNVCPPSEIVGYTVQQTIQIKVRDFSIIG